MNYAKTGKTKVASPRAKASGMSKFAHVAAPRQQPIKSKFYTKGTLREDPTKYAGFGFGDTGLSELK